MALLRDLSPTQARLCLREDDWRRSQVNVDGLPFKDTIDRPPPDPDHVAVCRHWLRVNTRPTPGIMIRAHSHALMKEARRVTGVDVTNGALIVAALDLGYRARRVAPRSVNAHFNLTMED